MRLAILSAATLAFSAIVGIGAPAAVAEEPPREEERPHCVTVMAIESTEPEYFQRAVRESIDVLNTLMKDHGLSVGIVVVDTDLNPPGSTIVSLSPSILGIATAPVPEAPSILLGRAGTQAGVAIFLDSIRSYLDDFAFVKTVIVHELFHWVGVGHNGEAGSLMYPVLGRSTTLKQSDLEMLAEAIPMRIALSCPSWGENFPVFGHPRVPGEGVRFQILEQKFEPTAPNPVRTPSKGKLK